MPVPAGGLLSATHAAVEELEDSLDSKPSVPKGRVGSTPTSGTYEE